MKLATGEVRNHSVYARLFSTNRQGAEEYRKKFVGEEKLDEVVKSDVLDGSEKANKEDKIQETTKAPVVEQDDTESQLREEYIRLLKDAGEKVHPATGLAKLREKCVSVGLLD